MSNPKKRVLLMYITKVSGHRQATLAIQQTLHRMAPDVEAPAINGFGYTYPVLEKIVNRAYMSVIRRTPKVWDYLYDNPKIVKNSQSIKQFLHKTSHEKLRMLFERHNPSVVVCTQAFPCGMVADYKRAYNIDMTLIGVLTDFSPHSFWINEGVDYYVVPSEDAKDRFIKKGVDEKIIRVYGIPIRPRFAEKLDKKLIADKLGVDLSKPVILIMGGGQGLGPIRSIVRSLIKLDIDIQIMVVAGTNKKVIKSLKRYDKKYPKKILVFEYVKNVDELMEVATLIITKPGGMTTAESLAKGLPMVVVNPIPGQEMRNTDFLIRKGIAVRIDNKADIGEEVDMLLRSPERLEAMRKAAYENARPNASVDIVKLILENINR